MDPIAALELCRENLAAYHSAEDHDDIAAMADHAAEIVRAFEAIDHWMTAGGFSPWSKKD